MWHRKGLLHSLYSPYSMFWVIFHISILWSFRKTDNAWVLPTLRLCFWLVLMAGLPGKALSKLTLELCDIFHCFPPFLLAFCTSFSPPASLLSFILVECIYASPIYWMCWQKNGQIPEQFKLLCCPRLGHSSALSYLCDLEHIPQPLRLYFWSSKMGWMMVLIL